MIRKLRPVAKLTSACHLLSAEELKELLGRAFGQMNMTATEDKPDHSDGYTTYTCEYGEGSTRPFALTVLGISQAGFTPRLAVNASADGQTKKRDVKHVGDAAAIYTDKHDTRLISAGKRSHGQTRTMDFAASKLIPERKFIAVAKLVMSRM